MTGYCALEEFSLHQLNSLRDDLQRKMSEFQDMTKKIDAEIACRFIDKVQSAYAAASKMDGTLTIDLPDGWKVKSTIRKTVKYDSDVMLSIASQLPWERAQKLFQVKVGMTEKLYGALDAVDPQLKMKIDEARTVTTSEPSLELIAPDA